LLQIRVPGAPEGNRLLAKAEYTSDDQVEIKKQLVTLSVLRKNEQGVH